MFLSVFVSFLVRVLIVYHEACHVLQQFIFPLNFLFMPRTRFEFDIVKQFDCLNTLPLHA